MVWEFGKISKSRKRVGVARGSFWIVQRRCAIVGGSADHSPGATALDFRQYLVNDRIVGYRFAQGGVQALEQLCDGFAVATDERNAHLLALGRERGPSDRRNLADGDLTARVVEEGLQVTEWRGIGPRFGHDRAR